MRLASCWWLAALVLGCSSGDSSSPGGAGGSGESGAAGASGTAESAGASGAPGEAGTGGSEASGGSGTSGVGGSDAGSGGEPAGGSGGSAAGQGGTSGKGGAAPTTSGEFDQDPFGADRPVKLYVPKGYVEGEPLPLVILLHGYGATGATQELLFSLKKVANERHFFYMYPDGTLDGTGKRFWNATNACCGFGLSNVDDVAYLSGLIDEVQTRYAVDPKRIYFVGHSNGGFMSYRMACELGGRVAGIASLAGATFDNPDDCKPKEPVSVLQIHGTADELVLYNGGIFYGQTFPSAEKTVSLWAQYDGCSGAPTEGAPIDVEPSIDGKETTVSTHGNCKNSSAVELWSIQGGKHVPALTDDFRFGMVDFLLAHPRP